MSEETVAVNSEEKVVKDLANYEQTTFDLIGVSNLLGTDDFQVLEDLKPELKQTFLTSQVFRTRTEMEISVLNDVKHPSADSKFWQCQREQNVMFQETVNLSFEYKKSMVEMKGVQRDVRRLDREIVKLERKLADETDTLEQEELQDLIEEKTDDRELKVIEYERLDFVRLNQERTAKDRIREIGEWHKIKERLIPQMSYGTDEVNNHQLLSYTKRFINQANVMGNQGSPAENQNLLGQLGSALKTVEECNLTDRLLADFPEDQRPALLENFKSVMSQTGSTPDPATALCAPESHNEVKKLEG